MFNGMLFESLTTLQNIRLSRMNLKSTFTLQMSFPILQPLT